MIIHVRVREGVDDDIASWYDAQVEKSDGVRQRRRPRMAWDERQGSSCDSLPFPSAAGGWEEWDDEAPWNMVEAQEEELWDVL